MSGKKSTLFVIIGIVMIMTSIVAFSVPLYSLFCRVTGYGGTTQFSLNNSQAILDQDISIRFNADVNDGLNWSFQAPQNLDKIKIGENIIIEYEATNLSSLENTATATFNVVPQKAGPYFIKTECFCFQKQTLKPGEKIKMPVAFYIDPSIAEDPTMNDISTIILSYTFFKYIEK